MSLRFCIHHHPEDETWTIEDRFPNPKASEPDLSDQSFRVLLDAIHFMFTRGYGEFSIRK